MPCQPDHALRASGKLLGLCPHPPAKRAVWHSNGERYLIPAAKTPVKVCQHRIDFVNRWVKSTAEALPRLR